MISPFLIRLKTVQYGPNFMLPASNKIDLA